MINQLKTMLSQHPDVKMAIVFGSVGARTETNNSDIDLAILFNQDMTLELKMNVVSQMASQLI